jgi:hypothetical protein
MQRQKVTKLLAESVHLILSVDEGAHKLELELAWTMRAVILIESKLREYGITGINVLQQPKKFWDSMDCTMLTIAIWALSYQVHSEYRDDEGFDIIASYITPENLAVASDAVNRAFMASLSDKRRKEIQEASQGETEKTGEPTPDPTLAPVQQ